MESAYRYYVIERDDQHRVFATAWPMRRADAERALLARLARDGESDRTLCLSAGSSAIAPLGAAVIMLDGEGFPHLALANDSPTARRYLAELGIDADEGTIVAIELLRTPRAPRFAPGVVAELAAVRERSGASSVPALEGAWCPICEDAKLHDGQSRCDACLRIDALLVPIDASDEN